MKIPDVGDVVYITDIQSKHYGSAGRVEDRKEGKVYNYGCEYHYIVLIPTGKKLGDYLACSFNDLQISFKRPKGKEQAMALAQEERNKAAIQRIADEISHMTQAERQAALRAFLEQSINAKIDSAEVIKNLFK